MGNTKSRDGVKRNDSKRHSRRARSEDSQKNMGEASKAEIERTQLQTKGNDSSEELLFQNLGKSLNRHEDTLESFVSAVDAQKGMVDGLVKLLAEKTEENADNVPQEKNILPDVMKDAADILRNMQKSSQSLTKNLTNSFEDIRCDIHKCLKQFGKDVSVIDIKHRKQVPESSQEEHIEEQMKRLKETIEEQRNKNEEIQRQNRILKNELKQYRPTNASATVQLFHTLDRGESINEIEKELKTILISKLGKVNLIPCRSASDIDDKKLVIVLCFVSTRLGADAATAIKHIKNPENAALLIIHIGEAHSLPDQKSSRSLTDQRFKNMRHIFELAFKSGNGFYPCDMNDQNVGEVCSFCKESPYGDKF